MSALKEKFPFQSEADWAMEQIKKYPEGEFFLPKPEDFTLLMNMYDYNLVCKKCIQKWINGRYKGTTTLFMYKHNMNYIL